MRYNDLTALEKTFLKKSLVSNICTDVKVTEYLTNNNPIIIVTPDTITLINAHLGHLENYCKK